MDDDYFKGLNGQATHDSMSNTMGLLQREQEMRHKKQAEEFAKKQFAKNIPPTAPSSASQAPLNLSQEQFPANYSEEKNEVAEEERRELTPEQQAGGGLIFLGFLLWYFVSEYWPWILFGIGVIIVFLITLVILEDDETE